MKQINRNSPDKNFQGKKCYFEKIGLKIIRGNKWYKNKENRIKRIKY